VKFAQLALATALVVASGGAANAQIAILQIHVIEGEGTVHIPGSRAPRFLTVEITDETGKPVEGAAITFHLPEDGPSGTFANGLRTEVATSDSRGRATVHGLTFNRVPGRFQFRIVASKEQARAGIVSFQYIAETGSGAAATPIAGGPHHRARWIAIAALVAGGAAAGILAGRGTSSSPPVSPTPPGSAAAPVLSIGAPTVAVGKP
jgi:hypothetical protein